MKRLLTLFLYTLIISFAFGQSLEDYCSQHLHVAQKEGTDSIVRRYFADVPSRGDTLYVAMYTPGLGPRLEVSLNFFHDYLKAADPDAEFVLLSINCSKVVAEKYWKRTGYKSDYQMYDTDGGYYDFLSFNSSIPLCTYVLKVDKRSGRIIFSGGVLQQSPEFCKALVAERDVRPYHTYPATGQGSTFPLPGDMGRLSCHTTGTSSFSLTACLP